MKSHLANVLDLELSCYPDGIFPQGERQEIIEVGLTTVDLRDMRILTVRSIPIIPTMSTISPFCTELTGWTEAALRKQGVEFEEAVRRLVEKYGSKNRLLVTDSAGDRKFVDWQAAMFGKSSPFGEDELNVSVLYCLYTGQFENVSLVEKLAKLGLEFEGRPHRADSDSKNIARLLVELKRRMGSIRPA
ncbi:MAG: exonuclease domain-containing protein [Candidatus Melainabacteria bacterium]|nr:exonuclease domain-containing protein [Candidatus Melainabacteria bacterium]